jgi:hypothetical protein
MKTIGTMHSHLAGIEYTSAQVHVGDNLILDREPENQHDKNAIKVINGKKRIGYLDRLDAFWLAPLMDGGLIELKGTPLNNGSHTGTLVELTIKITSRGETILSPNRKDSPQAAMHNSLLTVYFNLDGYSVETLKKVLLQYSTVVGDVQMLPETRLIFCIIMTRMMELQSRPAPDMSDKLRDYFKEIKVGQPISNEDVTVVPLFGKIGDDCKIRETINVPVSCVEAGRWNYSKGNVFRKSNVAAPQVRYSLHKSVNKNVKTHKNFGSDQTEIWDSVHKVAKERCVESETSCLNDVYDNYETRLKDFSEKIKYPDKSCGLAVFNGSKLVSVDYFGHPELMKANWNDIVRSVALGAVDTLNKPAVRKHGPLKADQEIKKFLDGIAESAVSPEKSPGKGQYVRSQSKKHEAGLLIDDDKLVHLSGYKIL